ncbi:HAD family hydrolase [Candidatus Synechococcus calcipolaris G9]|uniref:HAD family hydrolase n=1 Tax=Candidatus Synechococcus calcipolaris G9 TaxID=1497997 RepID=A0ABT6EW77_9SYNE|nr:HAD family hydrolase [Candidatus Synechococcus calcipolaris]MDG2990023.1 HAD family hydrolase [Candidatus Synechococcus calcipolaris G9]
MANLQDLDKLDTDKLNTLEALIFDVDGTLADTERDGHRLAFNQAFEESGLDWHWDIDLYGKLLAVAGGKERMQFYLDQFRPDWPRPNHLQEMIAELHRAKTHHYTRLLSEGVIPLRPGVKRLLMEARQAGLRLAIATTTTPANVTALLEHTLGDDSLSWFEVIAAGDMVPAKKPAPDIYRYTLEKMALPPQACLAFEDSRNGLVSAQASGLATIVTVTDYTRHHNFDGALLVLDCLGEPDAPFQVLQGQAGAATHVDLTCVQYLHRAI